MSSSSGVRESNDNVKRTIRGLILNEEQFIQTLRIFANTSSLVGLGSTGGEANNSPNEASGNFMARSGDFWLGQVGNAFDTIAATNITNDTLNVSKTDGVTFPVVILQGESPPTADDLVTIIQGDDVFPFQELVIRTRSSIITIKNSDNINTPDGLDLVLPVGSIIHLYFDSFLNEWVIDSGTPFFGGGGGAFLPTAGGAMFGPIAYDPDFVFVDSDGRVPITSSYMQSTGIGSPDDVFFFDGALFNGQQLEYQVVNQTIQIIKNAVLKNASSIVGNGVDDTITVTIDDTSQLVTTDKVNIFGTINFDINNVSIIVTTGTEFTYELGSTGNTNAETGGVQRGNIVMPDGQDLTLNSNVSTLGVAIASFIFDPTIFGTGWRLISSTVSIGGSSPLTTKGDLFGFNTTNARIPVGSNDLPLVADSTKDLGVGYEILKIAGGGTGLSSYTQGDILFAQDGGTNLGKLGIGLPNQILRVNSAGTLPEWGIILRLNQIGDVTAVDDPPAGNVLTWNGSSWINQSPSGGSPLTTKGDLFGFGTSDARVGVGGDALPLVANSSLTLGVGYESLKIAGGGTGRIAYTLGDILVGQSGGNNLGVIAVGGVNQFLRGGTTPFWSTIALNVLSDVTSATSPGINNVLAWNGSSWSNLAAVLNTLADVNITSVANGDLLQFNSTTSDWENVTGIDASKITSGILPGIRGGTGISAYTAGDILYAPSTGTTLTKLPIGGTNTFLKGGTLPNWSTISLTNLSDVNLTSPNAGNILTFNGSLWVNQAPSGGGGVSGIRFFDETDTFWHTAQTITTLYTADFVPNEDIVHYVFYVPSKDITVSALGVAITEITTTSFQITMGIYSVDLTNLLPLQRLLQESINQTDTGTNRGFYFDTGTEVLTAGVPIFIAFKFDNFTAGVLGVSSMDGVSLTNLPKTESDIDSAAASGATFAADVGYTQPFANTGLPFQPQTETGTISRAGGNLPMPAVFFRTS